MVVEVSVHGHLISPLWPVMRQSITVVMVARKVWGKGGKEEEGRRGRDREMERNERKGSELRHTLQRHTPQQPTFPNEVLASTVPPSASSLFKF
jgi:hypothetical protein